MRRLPSPMQQQFRPLGALTVAAHPPSLAAVAAQSPTSIAARARPRGAARRGRFQDFHEPVRIRPGRRPRLAAMQNKNVSMNPGWRVAAVALAAWMAAACTEERNPRYCGDGICIDPAYPFCDVDGTFGDLHPQCVAVDCAPGAFAACRGDDELRCNATGTNYDVTRCELGCDPSGGCRLCEAGQTACTNGKMSTCDAAGNVIASEPCPLGCFEDQPRCREIDPSNGLAPYMSMAANGPDLILENATLLIPLGRVISPMGQMDLHSKIVAAPQNGVPIQVFPVRSLTIIGNLNIRADGSHPNDPPAVAFAVHADV